MAAVVETREKRDRLMLHALVERRLALEEEARGLKAKATEVARRETDLRDEMLTLDAILGATPLPAPAVPAPSAQAAAVATAPVPAPASPPTKRRRKGSRLREALPKLRERFGAGTFTPEDVTGLLIELEGGEHRKAYFAAWSLVRDLLEDQMIELASEAGSGRRKKHTYKLVLPRGGVG